jgi:integrase
MSVIVREKDKGTGVYYVFINHKNDRQAQKVGEKATAETVAEKIRALITLGKLDLSNNPRIDDAEDVPTMNEYGATWLSNEIDGVLDDATLERYENVLRRDIYPFLGKMRVNQIMPKDIKDLLRTLVKSDRTSRSISLTRTVLSSCLTEAVVDGLIPTNPLRELSRNRKGKGSKIMAEPKIHKVNAFTSDETILFIDAAMAYSPDMYGPMFLTGFRTGLRLGELLALTWQDINWARGTIYVNKSFKRGVTKNPKTPGSFREVDMSGQLKEALEELHEKRIAESALAGRPRPYDVIFHYQGECRAQNTARKAFKVILKRIGLTGKRIHDMRHTYAVLLLSRGASINYIKDQMGHSSIKTTSDFYSRFIPGSNRQIVSTLDDPLSGPA